MSKEKGFTACGQFYSMGETQPKSDYIEYLKKLLKEIRINASKTKS